MFRYIRRHRLIRRYFPAYWIAFYALAIGLLQISGQTRDVRHIGSMGLTWVLVIGLLVWYVVAGKAASRVRWGLFVGFWVVVFGFFNAVTFENDGDGRFITWRFRWSPEPDSLLAAPEPETSDAAWQVTDNDYPGFLGAKPWAEVANVMLAPDWEANPPEELWRRSIGSGWSAFAIRGDCAVTQEQRGDQELIVSYRVSTGEIVWRHADNLRFDPPGAIESMGGPGPRATPTLSENRVVTQGATGVVTCLEGATGKLIWQHDPIQEYEAEGLIWGKSGSPLIVPPSDKVAETLVVVNVGAPANTRADSGYNHSLVAYRLEDGELAWHAGWRVTSYASPQLVTLAGVPQVLQVNQAFITSHAVEDGRILWEHPWASNSDSDAACSQVVPLSEDRLLLTKGYGQGASLLKVTMSEGSWNIKQLWQPPIKPVLKTKMGNVVVRDGLAFGIDGVLLQCVDIETGKSLWKKRRRPSFGHGQLLLVDKHLLVLTEEGEVLLIAAQGDKYRELASFRAFSRTDITWNNPSLTGNRLLIRNAREAACYRLPLATGVVAGANRLPATQITARAPTTSLQE